MPVKLLILCTVLLIFTASACAPIGAPEPEETSVITTVTEATAPPVEIYGLSFDVPPKKIVCLSPAITEIFYELYLNDRLVGVGEYCDYPPEALTEKVNCGSAANPDFDTIISLAPDVLITQSPIANKDITRLKNAGITLLNIPAVTDVNGIGRLYTDIALLCIGAVPEGMTGGGASIAMPGLDSFYEDMKTPDLTLGKFVYYLSDDFTAAGFDTFPGNFFRKFGLNICDGDSAVMLPEEISPKAVILPAYLSHLADEYFTDSHSRVYILSEEATQFLERPTSRVRFVITELAEDQKAAELEERMESSEEGSDGVEGEDETDGADGEDGTDETAE
ncbi:MAG: helical backbone metal receptor [Ruminococcus sp.]|jgi:ABC-type Fe3+-hydroxamate transport system substrate-binding protein|nr:helical backbone metal receptor [Ruminococcus sp.]